MESVLDKTVYKFSEKQEILQTIIIALVAFLVPTFLAKLITDVFGAQSVVASNSQIVVGSIVNTALVISAINLRGWKKIFGIITMPSLSTMFSGYIFKTASVYMVYMIPAIWVGNFALVFAYKYIMLNKNKHYFLAGIIGIIAKVLIILGCFEILRLLNIFPEKIVTSLQTAMGTTQAITASIGVVISYIIYKVEINKSENK